MRLLECLRINSFYFASVNDVGALFGFINSVVRVTSLFGVITSMSLLRNIYVNSLFIHSYLRSMQVLHTDFFCNYISVSGTGGDGKNTFNLTTVATVFLRLLNQFVVKNNATSYLTNKGSFDFLARLVRFNFIIELPFLSILMRRKCLLYSFAFILVRRILGVNFYVLRSSIGQPTLFNYAFATYSAFTTRYFFLGVNSVSAVPVCVCLLLYSCCYFTVVSSFADIDEPTLDSKCLVVRCFKYKVFRFVLDSFKLGFLYASEYSYLYCVDTTASLLSFGGVLKGSSRLLFDNVVLFVCLVLNLRYCLRITFAFKFIYLLSSLGFFLAKYAIVKYML
ncbi:hypothetical protein JSR02_00195 [Candidatus Vidania fulgoroideae]|uniref:Uncharacterized protein n=1 Tax=Candidatus Vidania fulgoroideorum TaxID=881286 RepID=A0A974X793_9PROT|nr:hypothetical protein JSR02_00195 [Candidatus Vidania fulgoroideae]